MVLADTSIWIDHFRNKNTALENLLLEEQVLSHPFVIGELSLGHLKKRAETLEDLQFLPIAPLATDAEVLTLVEKKRLFGKGIGWMDAHLLASCLLGGHQLWTADKTLASTAHTCGAKIHS